jgi:hypothetical protein
VGRQDLQGAQAYQRTHAAGGESVGTEAFHFFSDQGFGVDGSIL